VSIFPESGPAERSPAISGDLSRLRIDRSAPPRRRWLRWAVLAAVILVGVSAYPTLRSYYDERRAVEVDVMRATVMAARQDGGTAAVPVLVATGYVVARRSSDVGVKTGGRLQSLAFEEGTKLRAGQVIARIEHADLDAQLAASRAAVAEAEAQLAQSQAQRAEDLRQLERQQALAKDGIATAAALTAAQAAADVSAARVRTGEAAIASARARIRVTEEAIENTNVRAPFDGVVIKKRAEVGETVSPFGVAGQASREGGAIATIADLRELEVQTEVSENTVAKLTRAMPATVKLQAYPDLSFRGRLREIFPSADRAKAIVEVRVSILDPSADVKPEMTASVTFEQPASPAAAPAPDAPAVSTVLISRRGIVGQSDQGGAAEVWVVSGGVATRRPVTLGAVRLDQVEVRSGLAPGEAVVLNPPAALASGGRVRVRSQ
jgi:RND family efflux transporter MFP subunit